MSMKQEEEDDEREEFNEIPVMFLFFFTLVLFFLHETSKVNFHVNISLLDFDTLFFLLSSFNRWESELVIIIDHNNNLVSFFDKKKEKKVKRFIRDGEERENEGDEGFCVCRLKNLLTSSLQFKRCFHFPLKRLHLQNDIDFLSFFSWLSYFLRMIIVVVLLVCLLSSFLSGVSCGLFLSRFLPLHLLLFSCPSDVSCLLLLSIQSIFCIKVSFLGNLFLSPSSLIPCVQKKSPREIVENLFVRNQGRQLRQHSFW